jgi:cysteinyl-tRNA synthetase
MKLYNTLTRAKEEFAPLCGNTVRMYSCGPTVYNFAHIGNMRTYIFTDILRRALKLRGYRLKCVMNITDVGHLMSDADEGEDKIVKASIEQKKRPEEISDFYTKAFFRDLERLNIEKPEIIPKATDHIFEMIELVQGLLEKGYAYEIEDGIYFDISKFPEYGKLSGINLEDQMAGARVDVNEEKRNPADFALWKKAPTEHIMQWESPWGMGYPGWHIECSAMSRKYLGEQFDIHTGGVDHIPIHHENEIAQSQAFSGKPPARFWLHGEFMMVDGGKMSKKLGNTYTMDDLMAKGYSPMVFRFFCLNAHYRKSLNFTFEAMDGAKVSYERLLSALAAHRASPKKTDPALVEEYMRQFKEAIDDDLNIPLALGVLFTLIKEEKSADIFEAALKMDEVFGLRLSEARQDAEEGDVPDEVRKVAEERLLARRMKDYARADELREKLKGMGWAVKDSRDGYELVKL